MSRLSNDARVLDHAVQKIGTRKAFVTEAGAGVTGGTGTIWYGTVEALTETARKTTIWIDLTGLHGGGTAGDIIGVDGGTASCHLGRLDPDRNGTIDFGWVTCLELPAGGDVDVDLYSAVESTGAQDAAITGLDETAMLNGGDWTAGLRQAISAVPGNTNDYLYLTNGSATDAAYTAGRFEIVLFGNVTL